jgi:arabinogalactan endo-1,4-beta-galactosidase
MQYGQQHLNGNWYLFNGVTGARQTGFQYIGDQHKTVYYNGNGQMQYGQQHLNGNWYLFNGVTGARQTGFQYIGDQHKTVYYNNNGQMQYGQQHLNGNWYLFNGVTGARQTGFQYIGDQHKTVYYNNNGQMQYGQQHLNGCWYLFDNVTGAMKTGLYYIDYQHKVVYYAGNGQMQYGLRSINGTELYFNHTTGALEMNTNIANFFNSIATAAQQASRRYNLYPSLMMAQAALESGYGDSTLTKNAHNLFGVKYSGQGSYVTMPTIEYYNGHKYFVAAKFQAYSSYYDSLERYAQLIANSFYNSNRTHSANVATAAKNLYHGKYGSYATDPQYADKIINMINLYGLLAYDNSEF